MTLMGTLAEQFLRMAVFYGALQAARAKGLEHALEFATDCALARSERLHRIARQLVLDLHSSL